MNLRIKTTYSIIILILFSCGNGTDKKEESSLDLIKSNKITGEKNDFIIHRYEDEFNWREIETKISNEEKLNLTNMLRPHFNYFSESEFHKDSFIDKLHFADINNDSKIDAIFSGWSGGEPDIIRFFVQTENGFDKWFEVLQQPLKIKITDNTLNEITAIDMGCCDAYQVTISTYQVTDKLKLKAQTSYVDWTDLTGKYIEPMKFEIIKDKYFIRDSPKIDDESESERFESKGNSIGEFVKGQKGTAYMSKTDSTGRVWWLMQSEPLDSIQNSFFYNTNKTKTSYVGWISSRYVKKITKANNAYN